MDNVLYVYAIPIVILPVVAAVRKLSNVTDRHTSSRCCEGSDVEFPRMLPLVRVIAMPADANPNGDIFGGWLLAQMDLAGGSLATQRARGRCATVAVDGYRGTPPSCALGCQTAPGEIHLGEQPSPKDVAVRVRVGRHRDDAYQWQGSREFHLRPPRSCGSRCGDL